MPGEFRKRRCARVVLLLLVLLPGVFGANYFYDDAGHLIKVNYGSAGVVLYTYDGAGNLLTRQVQTPAAGSNAPVITGVANAESGGLTIAPNTWVAVYGTNLAPSGDSRQWKNADFVNNQLPTQLDGVSVTVNGKAAFIYYISPTLVNILTPPDPIQGQVQAQLTNGGVTSAAFNVQALPAAPSFFVLNGGPYVLAVHANGNLIGPASLFPGTTTPAQPGETILLFANGFGPISAAVTSSSLAQFGSLPTLPVVKIGGVAATVPFAGLISPGLYQFNVVVPASTPSGDSTVVATYNGTTTQSGILITVQQ